MGNSEYYRIVLADDHEIFRIGLKSQITDDPTLKIVGEAKNGKELLDLLAVIACDLVILDLWMPEMDGFAVLAELSAKFPHIKRVILSMDFTLDSVRKALSKGIDGFITKEDVAAKINMAINHIREGKKYFSNEIQDFILSNYETISSNQDQLELITKREKEIAGLIASGMINKEISSLLNISVYTVQFHRSNLMRKLELKNAADLIKFAMAHNLCPPG